jgi:hypothetical protein
LDKDQGIATFSGIHPFLFSTSHLFPLIYPSFNPSKVDWGPTKMNDAQAKLPSSPHESENFSEKGNEVDTTAIEVQDGHFIVDEAMEKTLNWKCDFKLLPPLIFLFLITFIDRTNIANAKIEGMTTDLKMEGNDYNMSLWILNIPYICLAIPSNMLMKKGFVKPSVYLSGLMFCWCKTILSRCMTLLTNYVHSSMHGWAGLHKDIQRCSCMQVLDGGFRGWLCTW